MEELQYSPWQMNRIICNFRMQFTVKYDWKLNIPFFIICLLQNSDKNLQSLFDSEIYIPLKVTSMIGVMNIG